uniref:CLIP domain-containing serine protease n=1 Tax=Cacopsylla melanoneura TaxID=428564 RepID=A0A8D8XXR3_9HEMI
MKNMKSLLPAGLYIAILFIVPASHQQDYDDNLCSTPRNEIGTCIGIRECRYLYDLLERERNNPAAKRYVQNSHCGVEGRLPKVCCPQSSLNGGWGGQPSTRPTTTRRPPNNRNNLGKFPDPFNNECGTVAFNSSKRIVGGTPSERGQWPWMAAVGFKTRNRRPPSKPEWMCGGALITKRYVMTAAHCVSRETTGSYEPYVVHLGSIDLEDTSSGVTMEIEQVIMHEDYTAARKVNDIALFRLRQEAVLTDLIQPVCLPFDDSLRSELFLKKTPFVAGWGSTVFRGPTSPQLRHVQISVVDNPTCRDIFQNYGATINDDILCAGVLSGGKDSCGGDSGGPLMLPVDTKFYIIGVVSYGKKCAEVRFPGYYTRVKNYIKVQQHKIGNIESNNIRC